MKNLFALIENKKRDAFWENSFNRGCLTREKAKLILAAVSVLLLAFAAFAVMSGDNETVTQDIPGKGVSFDTPASWNLVNETSNTDFHFSAMKCDFSGFIYQNDENVTDRAALLQNLDDQLANLCTDIKTVKAKSTRNVGGKTITTTMYEGSYDGAETGYYTVWIEFDNTDSFIWGSFSATPKNAKKLVSEWDAVADSAKLKVQL